MSLQLGDDRVQLLQTLDAPLLGNLFSTVLQRVSEDEERNRNLLSPDELEETRNQLNVADNDKLHLVLSSLKLIAVPSIFHQLSTTTFQDHLTKTGLSEALSGTLAEVWDREKTAVHNRFVESSFAVAPRQLDNASWKLKVISGQSRESCTKEPIVQLDLKMKGKGDSSSVEFNHCQLSRFYTELERIQSQIDLIQKQ